MPRYQLRTLTLSPSLVTGPGEPERIRFSKQLAAERRQLLRTLISRATDAAHWAEGARYGQLLIEADPGAL